MDELENQVIRLQLQAQQSKNNQANSLPPTEIKREAAEGSEGVGDDPARPPSATAIGLSRQTSLSPPVGIHGRTNASTSPVQNPVPLDKLLLLQDTPGKWTGF